MSAIHEPGRMPWIVRLAVPVTVLLAMVAGVTWFVGILDDPRRQTASATSDYADLCAGRPIPGAAEYVPGPGPHPVAVFANEQDETGSTGSPVTFGSGFDPAVYNPRAPETVQLVACADRTEDGPPVGTCAFQDVSAPMHRSTVEITVYEARTGEAVGEPVTVVAEDTTCPFAILYEGEPVVFSTPTPEQFHTVLVPIVGA